MSDKMINNKMYLSLSIGNNAGWGVLDHMLGLREDQPRGLSGNLAGVGVAVLRGSDRPRLSADHLLDSQRGGAAVNSQLRHRTALRRVASSRHTEATPSQARSSVATRS